ncbi:glycosyltransferase family 2 protein [Blautia sp. HCP28S3_G10]|uniref:glycosyltransferase family 2 protein n=1 Tax=Blautia sp. HCP28S3_G10 TaxID=3438908 RepID=UPI003F8A5D23
MKEHYISVAMCTYNGEKYVAEQIKSILSQSHPIDEIVIGDDGSTDKTVEIVEQILKTSKVKYKIIQNKTNLGYRKNFENAIANTTGDIIFLSDQDDVWIKEKVKILLRDLDEKEEYLLVFSDAYLVDGQLNKMEGSLWESVYYLKNKCKFNNCLELFLNGYYVTGATVAFKRTLFEKAYPFSEIWQHDGWLGILAALYGDVFAEEQKLILYRQHGNNQIGAEIPQTIKEKINCKFNTLKSIAGEQAKQRIRTYRRFEELYERQKNSADIIALEKIKACVKAQKSFSMISAKRKINSLKIIVVHWVNGDYRRYRKKPIGFCLGDILSCFLEEMDISATGDLSNGND